MESIITILVAIIVGLICISLSYYLECKRYKKGVQSLIDQIHIQSSYGNWNYDSYMHGMANGLICALSNFTGETPIYLEDPDKYLFDKEMEKAEGGDPTLEYDVKVTLPSKESIESERDQVIKVFAVLLKEWLERLQKINADDEKYNEHLDNAISLFQNALEELEEIKS